MPQFTIPLPVWLERYFAVNPVDVIAAHALFTVAAIFIANVLIWGLIQVWQDYKQGRYASTLKWKLLAVNVPKDSIQSPKGIENFFANLAGSKSGLTWKERWIEGKFQAWFSFEIVSHGGHISYYIRALEKYRDMIEAALYAQYPEAQIVEVEDYVDVLPDDYPNDDYDVWGSEVVLGKEQILPIRTYEAFEHMGEKDGRFKDPLLAFLEGLGKMRPGEYYWFQILIMPPEEQSWTKQADKFIEKAFGKEAAPKKGMISESVGWIPGAFLEQVTGFSSAESSEKTKDQFAAWNMTPQTRNQVDAVAKKAEKVGWYTKMRLVYGAKKEVFRKGTIASMSKGILNQYSHQYWNKLGLYGNATPKDDYFWQEWQVPKKQKELVRRYKNRSFGVGSSPYILNTEELATIWHFPAADARTPVLTSIGARRAEAPIELDFIAEDAPDLLNLERTSSDAESALPARKPTAAKLVTPKLTAPTGTALPPPNTDKTLSDDENLPEHERIPEPGKPAPLPPGLDLSDEPIDDGEGPQNLPR